jgi:hypothetical protein
MKKVKYSIIDRAFLLKFFRILNTFSNNDKSIYHNKNAKQIFVKRTLAKWLSDKYIVIIKKLILNSNFNSNKTVIRQYYHILDIDILNSIGKIDFLIFDPLNPKLFNYLELDCLDLINLEFKIISKREFNKINNLFNDNRE